MVGMGSPNDKFGKKVPEAEAPGTLNIYNLIFSTIFNLPDSRIFPC